MSYKRKLSIIKDMKLNPWLLLAGLITNAMVLYFVFTLIKKPAPAQPGTITPTKTTPSYNTQTAKELIVEKVVDGLKVPWSMVFTGKDRILVAERPGKVRVVEKGTLRNTPLKIFSETEEEGELGLMGLALDPQYSTNKFVYACLGYRKDTGLFTKVVRFKDINMDGSEPQLIIDNIPAAQFHSGCRLRFDGAGYLFITTGDATDKELAQDKNSLAGKILRVNSDGTIPADNPFPASAVWSLGHRNPQGLDFHPLTGKLWSTEHGPSGNDGPPGGDEINNIVKGGNYGWPKVSHNKNQDGFIAPKAVFTPAVAPASGMFYTGSAIPQWSNQFFFGGLRGEGIWRIKLNEDGSEIVEQEKLPFINFGRIRDVVTGPDGYLYFTTSNTDGRGKAQATSDAIYRIKPKE